MAKTNMRAQSIVVALFLVVGLHAQAAALIDLGVGQNYTMPPRSISTNGEFEDYASSTLAGNETVESISFTPREVRVRFREVGKLLALVSVTMHPEVIASPNGDVEVKYPWYSRIAVDKKNELEAKLESRVKVALNSSKVGVIHAAEAEPSFSAQKAALVSAAILAELDTSTSSTAY